jgi:hypothetical protein
MTSELAIAEAIAAALPQDFPADFRTGAIRSACAQCSRVFHGAAFRSICAICDPKARLECS